jgi:hypothetical protein
LTLLSCIDWPLFIDYFTGMIALLALLMRAGLLALILVMVWSLFFKRPGATRAPRKPKQPADPGRFDEAGENISEGDFKEL